MSEEQKECELYVNYGSSGSMECDYCDHCGVEYSVHPSRYQREYDEVMAELKLNIAYFQKDGEWLADSVVEFVIRNRDAFVMAMSIPAYRRKRAEEMKRK